ncbi:calnexin [Gamsiella multidivaricata]|uniref:calnexin n=1 Tax=Gamsiella multidivaricata TaxID=101098 RepID=UPI00222049B0|nr:calnexin [Gamsiella multidivaricata]KAG0361074.1 hypothetical protein BGZ54_009255 [Gamsiella multidivaricata]KAI7821670.1 calnexin [Gamsiella multidivaricata]
MTRGIQLGLAAFIALSSAVAMVDAHDHGHEHPIPTNLARHKHKTVQGTEPPVFKATSIKGPFLEQFVHEGGSYQWLPSNATREPAGEGEIFSYVGQWAFEEPHVYAGTKNDLGLIAKTPAAHHAISASIPEAIDNKDNTLVVQYEVKAQNGMVCGGAYMKLLTESPEGIKFKEFSNETPYTIMFGPDKCGTTDKIHFIFRHKNPITGKYEEKHLRSAPSSGLNELTTLYTLIVKPDQTFEIKVNGDSVTTGSLLNSFQPEVNPPKEIDDPTDSKPADWVEEAKVPDPTATKPEDWDENAPPTIPDENATKPDDWLEDEEAEIPDPEAVKPEDWDDEEDGDWIPTTVPNPKCQDHGCGKWTRPNIPNPAYKGKWSTPLIDNPAYKGVWAPRKIPNPEFFEDLHPSNFEKIGAVGFEIWTMQDDVLFDNIYIGHSVEDAAALAAETFEIKYPWEKKLYELANPKPDPLSEDGALNFKEDPVGFVLQHLREFIVLAREDPMGAINARPLVVSALAAVVGVSFGLMLIIIGLLSPSIPAVTKETAFAKKTDKEGESSTAATEEPEGSALRKRTVVPSDEN